MDDINAIDKITKAIVIASKYRKIIFATEPWIQFLLMHSFCYKNYVYYIS